MWLKWIADKKDLIESGAPDDLSLQMELIELYKRSILDYLCKIKNSFPHLVIPIHPTD